MKENFVCIPVDVSRNWSLKNLTSSLLVVVVVMMMMMMISLLWWMKTKMLRQCTHHLRHAREEDYPSVVQDLEAQQNASSSR